MRRIFISLLSILTVLAVTIPQTQAQTPVTKTFEWTLPNQSSDGSPLIDLTACRIYASTVGPTNFVAGTNSPNFLVSVPASTPAPIGSVTNSKAITWSGYFNDTNIWLKVTAVDDQNNESEFSNFVTFSIDNVPPNKPINLIIKLTMINNVNFIEIIASRPLEGNEKFVFSTNLNSEWINVPNTLITNNSILIPISNSLDKQFFAITTPTSSITKINTEQLI